MATAELLNDLRKRILADEPVTREELREAIKSLTGERIASAQATVKKTKAPSVKVDLDDLL